MIISVSIIISLKSCTRILADSSVRSITIKGYPVGMPVLSKSRDKKSLLMAGHGTVVQLS